MSLILLRKFLAFGLVAVAGYCWGTESPSLPQNDDPKWQDISNIQWSTNNGATWGTSALVVGQSVQFKITMDKANIGNHYADFVKAWIDLDGNNTFESNEAVLFGYNVANATFQNWNNPERKYTGQPIDFISASTTLTSAMVGDRYLLARVTCSESLLGSWNNQWNMTPTWYNEHFYAGARYGQGESELVKLSVNSVPEPSTLALFAIAMIGMGLGRKQTTRV